MPGAPQFNPYNVPPPGVPAAGQPPAHFGQQPLQSVIPAVPGVQSTSIPLGFEAAPDFNVVQRLKGPSELLLWACLQPNPLLLSEQSAS